MTKNSKNNYSVIGIFMMLCLALVFSCTNVTNTSVIAHGKKTLAQPTFDTEGGAVDYGTIVKFSYTPNDAQLYYTLDGSEPDIEDKDTLLYDPSNGIEITESCIIKARLYHSNYYPSTVAENMFNVTLAKPKFSPNGGNITTNDEVTLSHDLKGVDIYYTIDGTTPTDDMEEYAKPFCIKNKTGSVTVKAIAMKDGLKSKIAEQVFNVRDADGVYLNELTVNSSDGTNYLTNFNPLTNDYDISVPNSVDSVTVYGSGTNASVERGNGQYTLNAGEVTKVTVVLVSTTDSSKTNEYTVKITRAREGASDDATLSVLELQGNGLVTLTPSFSSDMKEYTATVDNAVSSVIVNFSTNHFAAKADYKSGDNFDLVEGENTLKIQVTAEDGETKLLYTVKITRGSQINNNAELKSVTVNGKSVSVSSNMSYTVSESSVRVVATPEDPAAKVKINGDAVTATNVNVLPSTVNIEVTAEDGKTVKKYILDLKAGVVPPPTPNCLAELKTVTVNGEDVTVGSAMTYTTSSKPDADIVITAEGAASTTINSVAGTSTSVKISDDGKTATKVVKIELTDTNGTPVTYTLALTYKAVITDKIVLHAYGYKNAYVWETGDSSLDKKHKTMTKEGSTEWYTATFNVTSMNVIFTKSEGGWDGQTSDLSQKAGEWWYKDGKWTEYNPEDTAAPLLTSFTCDQTGTATGNVTFTVVATDDKNVAKVLVSLDGSKVIATIDASGAAYNGTFVWNSAASSNGNHTFTAIAEDSAGNVSNEISLNLITENVNAKPEAVITGGTRVKKGSAVTYNALRSTDLNGTVEGYSWRVSGATILKGANEASCEIQFPDNEGKVTIYLTVTDNEHADSAEVSHEVDIVDQVSNDFREESIYFLMTTRFYDGDPSNNEYCWDEGGEYLAFGEGDCAWRGDFKGIAEKLDYIKALGFSAIWITPVVENASGIDYHGYHAYDFSRVDPRYESTDFTYQKLIDACHAKGIKVIQDIVLNHTGNFGERNLFHMFDKETTPYINKDVPTPAGGKRSPFMKVAKNGNAYQHLMKGLKQAGGSDYDTAIGGIQYGARINAMKEDSIDTDFIYHHAKMIDWNSENCQLGQMAGDCVDLNTENPTVYNYLIDCYNNYINMGVDGFRVDTVKHISRLTFNETFMPAFMQTGGENFFVFGETCARYRGRWNEGVPALSPSFYTWKETESVGSWSSSDHKANSALATAHFTKYRSDFKAPVKGTPNHRLNGNEYHKPDWSLRNHLDQIDFPMHWAFSDVNSAYQTCLSFDDDFNDATFNVTYVDSHDYAPDNAPENQRFNGYWPDKLNLMFTFRGIPCIYYGSEIEFMKGAPIDPANTRTSCNKSGRAYLGDHLEGTVTASDYGTYTASGTVAETLNHELAQHIIRLNQIRRKVPALQKGQYSTEGCSGNIAFKRRYTENGVDSFVLVAINGGATFTGVPNGTYVDLVTGETKSGSTITTSSIGTGNMRVYVLQNQTAQDYGATGKIGKDGAYLK